MVDPVDDTVAFSPWNISSFVVVGVLTVSCVLRVIVDVDELVWTGEYALSVTFSLKL